MPQYAFKNLMIHWILQFTLLIAIRCVLHRMGNQEIHRPQIVYGFWFELVSQFGTTSVVFNGFKKHKVPKPRINPWIYSGWQAWTEMRDFYRELARLVLISSARLGKPVAESTLPFAVFVCGSCQWSFRRFTYGNLVTTSPSSRWLSLQKFSMLSISENTSNINPDNSLNHPIGRSDGRCVQRAGT